MHDAGTRETAGIKCRGKEERRKARMDARRIDASGSAEPMSGSNPDEMDGEGAAFAKRRQLPRRKSQMASRGMEEEKAELMLRKVDVL
jgi:hypothetical protein